MPLAGPPDTPPKSTASFLAVGPSPCSVREARTRRSREQPSSWGAHFRTVDSVMAFRTRRGMAAGRCRQKAPRTFPGQQRGQWPPQAPWRLGEALWAGRWTGWSDYRGRETQIPRYRTLPKRAVKPPEHRCTHRGDATALRVQAPSGRAPRHARTVRDVTAPLSRTDRTQTRTVGRPQARSTGPAAVTLPPRGGGGVGCACAQSAGHRGPCQPPQSRYFKSSRITPTIFSAGNVSETDLDTIFPENRYIFVEQSAQF